MLLYESGGTLLKIPLSQTINMIKLFEELANKKTIKNRTPTKGCEKFLLISEILEIRFEYHF
jgi:hypothetical protein